MSRNTAFILVDPPDTYVQVDESDYIYLTNRPWWLDKHPETGQTLVTGEADNGKTCYMHRMIMGLSPEDSRDCKHRNNDILDCRKRNLIFCRDYEKEAQLKDYRDKHNFKVRGYHWNETTGKYFAKFRDKNLPEGYGDCPIKAYEAWKKAKAAYKRPSTHHSIFDRKPLLLDKVVTERNTQADPPASLFPNLTNTPPMPPGVFAGVDDTKPVPDDLRKPTTEQATTGKRLFPNLNEPKK